MAELTFEQGAELSSLLVAHGLAWHKANVAWGTPEQKELFTQETDAAMLIFKFIEEL